MTDNSNSGEYVGSWRSAVDELRERELRETEKNLLQRLLALPADTFDEILHLQHRQKSTLEDCMTLLHRIQGLLAELHRDGGSGHNNNGTGGGGGIDDEDDNAAFLMWLTTVPPKLLIKIEAILVVTQSQSAD